MKLSSGQWKQLSVGPSSVGDASLTSASPGSPSGRSRIAPCETRDGLETLSFFTPKDLSFFKGFLGK